LLPFVIKMILTSDHSKQPRVVLTV